MRSTGRIRPEIAVPMATFGEIGANKLDSSPLFVNNVAVKVVEI